MENEKQMGGSGSEAHIAAIFGVLLLYTAVLRRVGVGV
jgi:hypothetical protein